MAVVATRDLHTVRVPEGVMHQCQSIDIRLCQHPSRLDFNQLHHRGPVASLPRGARNETREEVETRIHALEHELYPQVITQLLQA